MWERPSLGLSTRPDKPLRRMTRNDVTRPRGPYTLRTAGLTLAAGAGMAVLYVFFPLLAIAFFVDLGGWLLPITGIAALVFWLVLFVLAVREHASDQRYLRTF